MDIQKRIADLVAAEELPAPIGKTLHQFYQSYKEAIENGGGQIEDYHKILYQFVTFILEQLHQPFQFPPYHQALFDYFHFGLNFIRPLVLMNQSTVHHLEIADQITQQLNEKDNVILFANHQTEPDPQAISLLLERSHPRFAREIIFVAGHRVTSDPLAVPFSKGCNLLCIYSKKYVEHPPEKKEEKLSHNRKTMKRMSELLAEGGKCIYVAPSGGRDRPDTKGELNVAPFDPQSIEMFYLMAKQAKHPTHFYPLALYTYHLLPPPSSVLKDLGETRHAQRTPIHLAFGKEIEMEDFPGNDVADRKHRRQKRAQHIWSLVQSLYEGMIEKS